MQRQLCPDAAISTVDSISRFTDLNGYVHRDIRRDHIRSASFRHFRVVRDEVTGSAPFCQSNDDRFLTFQHLPYLGLFCLYDDWTRL